jgi:hypothetical protein
MTTENSPPQVYVPRCVSFYSAVQRIAHKNLAGWAPCPSLLQHVYDHEDEEADALGRERFAFDLLLDHARRGLVRLYASEHYKGEDHEDVRRLPSGDMVSLLHISHPGAEIQLPPEFLKDADFCALEYDEVADWPVFSNDRTGETYSGIAVEYNDLTLRFWGGSADVAVAMSLAKPALSVRFGGLVDLVAWHPRQPSGWALRTGAAEWLGAIEPQHMGPPPVPIRFSVLSWFQYGCSGLVILSTAAAVRYRLLSDCLGGVEAESAEHAAELKRMLAWPWPAPRVSIGESRRVRDAA